MDALRTDVNSLSACNELLMLLDMLLTERMLHQHNERMARLFFGSRMFILFYFLQRKTGKKQHVPPKIGYICYCFAWHKQLAVPYVFACLMMVSVGVGRELKLEAAAVLSLFFGQRLDFVISVWVYEE